MFEGKLKNSDIGYEDYPWEVVPFLQPIDIQGIDFIHYATSGLMGRPIGGIHPAWSIIKKRNKSTVVGHSHVTDYKIDRTPGRSLMGLACGSYVDYEANYAGPANDMWSRGIAVLDDAADGIVNLLNIVSNAGQNGMSVARCTANLVLQLCNKVLILDFSFFAFGFVLFVLSHLHIS